MSEKFQSGDAVSVSFRKRHRVWSERAVVVALIRAAVWRVSMDGGRTTIDVHARRIKKDKPDA